MKSAFAFVALLLLPPLAFSAEVKDHTGTCTVTVPSDWTISTAVGNAQSPDKKISITVSSPTHGLNSLDQVKQIAPGIYKDDKVTKSSGSEFEMEGANQAGKPNVYRAVPAGAKVCIAEIVYQSGTVSDAKAIITTLNRRNSDANVQQCKTGANSIKTTCFCTICRTRGFLRRK